MPGMNQRKSSQPSPIYNKPKLSISTSNSNMVAINKGSLDTGASQPTTIVDEEQNGENLTVPLVGKGGDKFADNGSGGNAGDASSAPAKKPSGLGESAAFWLFMLFLASVTMTVGNKYVMKKWGDFANTLTLLQNGTAVLYLAVSRYFGVLEMKPITGQQWRVFAATAFFLSMQILTSLKALPYVASEYKCLFSFCIMSLIWSFFPICLENI